jgi:hypothetical protein
MLYRGRHLRNNYTAQLHSTQEDSAVGWGSGAAAEEESSEAAAAVVA